MSGQISTGTNRRKVLIVGAGIGGAALALFLKRAGIESETFEARDTVEGYSLSLSCNGVAVLKLLGLDQAAFAEGSPVSKWEMWNKRGRRLGGGSFTSGGIKSVFIKRVSLGSILTKEAERQGIVIHWGKKLQNVETTSTGVVATFEDGTTVSSDLIIGADGAHSRIRQYVDPASHPVYTGLINGGGYTQGVKAPTSPETSIFIFCKRAFFGYHVSPTGYIYWFVNYARADEPLRETLQQQSPNALKAYLLELFHDDQPYIRQIIEEAECIFPEFVTYALPTQPHTWHKGPIGLLGDAAHAISPSSGQGASMALEDAAILAKCLRDIPDWDDALTQYEQLRRERTAKMYEQGERGDSGKFKVRPFDQWTRDLLTPVFLKLFANDQASEWIYSYRIDWDKKVVDI